MKRVIHFTARQLYWGGSLLAIGIGIFITVTRVLMPYLDTYRGDLEEFAGKVLNRPVSMAKASAWWEGVEPVFRFDNVKVLEKKGGRPLLEVGRLQVNIGILRSLWYRRLEVESLTIEGVSIKVHQSLSGDLSVNGLSGLEVSDTKLQRNFDVNELIGWLLSQPSLAFNNIKVDWIDKESHDMPVEVHSLGLNNEGDTHVLSGKLFVRNRTSDNLEFNLDVQGDWRTPQKLKIKLYLHILNLALPDWIGKYHIFNKQIIHGTGAGKMWVDWVDGKLAQAQLLFQGQNILFKSDKTNKHYKLNYAYGNVGLRLKGKDAWSLGGDHLLLSFPDHTSDVSQFQLNKSGIGTEHPKTALWLNYLDLKDLSRLLIDGAFLPESINQLLKRLSLEGELKHIKASFEGARLTPGSVKAEAIFDNIGFKSFHKWPGLLGFSGAIKWIDGKSHIDVLSDHFVLTDKYVFLEPLKITYLKGTLDLFNDPAVGWRLLAKNVHANNNNFNGYFNAALDLPNKNKPPLVSLLASADLKDVKDVQNYLPAKEFDPGFARWLSQAFLSGALHSTVIWRGDVVNNYFPYDDHPTKGTFAVKGDLDKVDFRITPQWPYFHDLIGNLSVFGSHIMLNIDKGSLLNSAITSINADIPKLQRHQDVWLRLNGHLETSGEDVMTYLQHSPLKHNIGKALAHDEAKGKMGLDLQMRLPVEHIGRGSTIYGRLNLRDDYYHIKGWPFAFEHAGGQLRFNQEALLPSSIKSMFWREPMRMLLNTYNNDGVFGLQGYMESSLAVSSLEDYFQYSLAPYVSGTSQFHGYFNLRTGDNGVKTQIQLGSDLHGVAVHMPTPLAKPEGPRQDFKAVIHIDQGEVDQVRYQYGHALKGSTSFLHEKSGVMLDSDNVFSEFHWEKWKEFIDARTKEMNPSKSKGVWQYKKYIKQLNVEVKDLNLFDQSVGDVLLSVSPTRSDWLLAIDSKPFLGELEVPDAWGREPLTGKFKRIHITPPDPGRPEMGAFSPDVLPPIIMDVDDLRFGEKTFGVVHLDLLPVDHQIKLRSIKTSAPNASLDAKGSWKWQGGKNVTYVAGTVSSDDLETLFKEWHYDSALVGTTGQAVFEASWPEAPYNLHFQDVTGTMSMDLGQGRIVDIDEGTATKLTLGKFINLLSVETLTRRLTLNFSDVGKKGYHFDTVKSNLIFKDHNLHLEKMDIEGHVADLSVTGRVGLNAKDYDLLMAITPDYTGSLPVAAGLVTLNPIVGVATWAVDKLISPQVNKLTAYHFLLTGPWDKPALQQISEKEAKTREPAPSPTRLPLVRHKNRLQRLTLN